MGKTRQQLRYRIILPAIFILSVWGTPLHAQSDFYFKQISLKEGLIRPTVTAIVHDSKGYVWIGSRSGLGRFDKYEIKNYFNDPDVPGSLPDNHIIMLAEDSVHNLWVGTNGGLALYNRKDDTFETISYEGRTLYIYAATLMDDGVLFCGNSLFKYDYATRQITEIAYDHQPKDFICFVRPGQGEWLLGTRWDGLWALNPETGQVRRTITDEKEIQSYFVDSDGNLWLAPYGKGVACYSADGTVLEQYRSKLSQLTNDIVLDIAEKDGKIWLATDGSGICILDGKTGHFEAIGHIPGDNTSLPANSITRLYKDRENNMWAGTVREGLIYIRNVYMKTYGGATPGSPYGLSESAVISLYEDEDHTLWIGTDGGGLNAKKQKEEQFSHYAAPFAHKITSITKFSDHELLCSTFGEGLYVFDKRRHNFKPFVLVNEQINNRTRRNGRNIYLRNVNGSKIYFFADSIYVYDTAKRQFAEIRLHEPQPNGSAPINSPKCFYSDENKTLLFCNQIILELDHATDKLRTIYCAEPATVINSVCKDSLERLWLGTNKGLLCYTPADGETKPIKTSLFREISAMAIDADNRLWIGAQGLLFTYFVDQDKFTVWGESDGVSTNEFLSEAVLVTASGDIYMGGSSGMLRISRDIRFDNDERPAIEVAEIYIDGSAVWRTGESAPIQLAVPWNHTSISLKIQAMEKDFLRKTSFRYRISTSTHGWTNRVRGGGITVYKTETYNQTLSIHALKAGKYVISVSCSLPDGNYSEPAEILQLEVLSPWYKSGWFVGSWMVAIILLAILLLRYNLRRKEKNLEEQLRTREEEDNKDKIRFLINISHELRTPLTLVYAPLKRLLQSREFDDNTRKQLTGIYKQVKRMRSIINMTLDARKMEVGKGELYLRRHAFNPWVKDVADDFRNEFEHKNVELHYDLDAQIGDAVFDAGKLETVLCNLLMNALKFSQEHTTVTIQTISNGNFVRVLIKDQGIGLAEDAFPQLFTRFSQGTSGQQGTGIGLSYAKTLIDMHGGHIGAYNNPDKGATFYFELPLLANEQNISVQKANYLNDLFGEPDKEEPAPVAKELPATFSNYVLLVVEDEADLRRFLVNSLAPYFAKVHEAANGADALSVIRNYPPDILVSDVMMPRMDGFTLCQKIKSDSRFSHIPIILLTARADHESTNLGYKLGADGYLPKPFDIETLLLMIGNNLHSREQIRQRSQERHSLLSPEEQNLSNADEDFMMRLNKHIRENLETLDVKLLVQKMNTSRSTLYSKLSQLTGMGVNDYINKFRIEKAMQLLERSDMSILEISEKTGFTNQSYFSSVFKHATGLTPTKYKEQARKTSNR